MSRVSKLEFVAKAKFRETFFLYPFFVLFAPPTSNYKRVFVMMATTTSEKNRQVLKEMMAEMSLSEKIGQMSQIELGLLLQDNPNNPGMKIVDHVSERL